MEGRDLESALNQTLNIAELAARTIIQTLNDADGNLDKDAMTALYGAADALLLASEAAERVLGF